MKNEKPYINTDILKPYLKMKPFTNTRITEQKINGIKRSSSTSLNKFSLLHEEILPVNKLKKNNLFLTFKLYSKIKDSRRIKQRMDIKITDKYKVVLSDLKNRIHTASIKCNFFGITDIDKDYYLCLNGRQLNLNAHSYKMYKLLLMELFRTRQAVGHTQDCILNVDVNNKNELKNYDLSKKRFTEQVTYLDMFINEDYQKSMELLEQCEKLRIVVDLKSKELQNLGNQKFTIMSSLISLDYVYSIQQKYGRFLYYLSPPSWRTAHREFARSIEIEQKGFDLGKSSDDDTFDIIFDKLYGICYGTAVKPVLYFGEPSELINIFNSLEEQQLYYFTHVNHLAPYIKTLASKIQVLKDLVISDTSPITRLIKSLTDELNLKEERCSHLEKKFCQILGGLFYDSTAATDVLKLNFNLKFCFEKVFGGKATHMDIVAKAKSLENLYMTYSKSLDKIQNDTIRRCLVKYSEKERIKFKKANIAKIELRLFDRLEKELSRTFDFTVDTKFVPIKNKSNKTKKQPNSKLQKLNVKENKKLSLSDAQMEYLKLFTEWTYNEDPAQYLQSFAADGNE